MTGRRTRTFTLTTPSLGVRQWRDDASNDRTRIAWASIGGRGVARAVITLPVVHDGTRWVLPDVLHDSLQKAALDTWRDLRLPIGHGSIEVGVEDRDNAPDPAAPRATDVRDERLARWGGDHLVVLLVYDEPAGIGDPGDVDAAQTSEEATYREEIEAVEDFFGSNYDRRLVTRGLVRRRPLPPPDTDGDVTFAVASCQYPADMSDGAPNDHRGPGAPASASLLQLARLLTSETSPSLLILAGDQVYVDATRGLFDARSQNDHVRLPYQNLLSSPGAQSVFGLLPVAMILDDHELMDNWEPGIKPAPAKTADPIADGRRAYRRFQRMAGPPLVNAFALWCTFRHGGVPFFLADTRTERATPGERPRRVDNWRDARIMSADQWNALREFLLHHRDGTAFVVSPAMLLPRGLGLGREPALALERDSWDGFPASMYALLALLCDNELSRVVFLSGDAHISCVARITVTGAGHSATLWSVHSSGLYCPYPFANARPEDFAGNEVFRFTTSDDGGRREYRCTVETEWVPGDGFATVTVPGGGRRRGDFRVSFHGIDGARSARTYGPMRETLTA